MEEVAAASVEETNINEKKSHGSVGCATFLPRMFLRVLLVEGDDSTRHIIAALLRKCSYKGQFLILLFSAPSALRFDA